MSNLQYFSYEGVGQNKLKQHGYSQAVRVSDRIECAGQGGQTPKAPHVASLNR
jgi:enamine deaminase RidA (YjgF/YER057c/UK114 family)